MTTKPTGLAAFARNRGALAPSSDEPVPKPGRRRAQGETVALTVRIPRAEWARLH